LFLSEMLPDFPDDVLQFLPLVPKLGVAVSGGGDSVALLLTAQAACAQSETQLFAATVNHGLRDEAAAECDFVRDVCAEKGIPHQTLMWDGKAALGNVQAAARDARYRLLADWAQAHDISHVLLGHTADDQAETILMAIGRGAGAEGLAGMTRSTGKHAITFLRPWLHISRSTLRDGLRELGQKWVDDPSNDDHTYQRIRIRSLLEPLAQAGVPLSAFGQVAENMASSASMLNLKTAALKSEHVIADQGDYLMRQDLWKRLGFEQARRLAVSLIMDVNGGETTPRRAEQKEVLRRLRHGQNATIAGCRLSRGWGMVRFSREPRAVGGRSAATDAIWDGRWRFDGPHAPHLHVAALSDGVKMCPKWRESGLPEASLRASPAIWDGAQLISAPLARLYEGWAVQIVADLPTSASGH
jgi:tRNA(Ile)-lysidine synthase